MNAGSTDDDDAGNSFLDCAVEIAKSIEGLEGRSEILSLIAIKYAAAGQLDVAVDLVETINDSYLRDQARAGVAARCIEVGAADYADKLSETIEDDTAYALATEQMAVAYAQSGEFEKSIEVANRLTESAPTLSRIALACFAGGLSAKAIEVARSLDYPDLKASVLVELADKTFDDGRNPEALGLLQEATKAAAENRSDAAVRRRLIIRSSAPVGWMLVVWPVSSEYPGVVGDYLALGVVDGFVVLDRDLAGDRFHHAENRGAAFRIGCRVAHVFGANLIDEAAASAGGAGLPHQDFAGVQGYGLDRFVFVVDDVRRDEHEEKDRRHHDVVLDAAAFVGPEDVAVK